VRIVCVCDRENVRIIEGEQGVGGERERERVKRVKKANL
jgi:hypothetical protein